MIRGVQFTFKMASTEVLKRLETRATAAEKMIEMLRNQINELRVTTDKESSVTTAGAEIKALTIENAQLKEKIADQKKLLIAAETKAGITQVSSNLPGNL